jgi:DNA-binding GntR family transcriptional regulator
MTPKISQSTLAAMVGVSRENVNRVLSALAAEGSIRRDNGRYVLVDEERLRWPQQYELSSPKGRFRTAAQRLAASTAAVGNGELATDLVQALADAVTASR